MINIEVGGTLPRFMEPTKIFEQLANRMAEDLRADVMAGGNPNTWKQTIFGKPADLSYIIRTMKIVAGDNFAEIEWGGTGYAKVHERGMNIVKSPKMRAAMWAKLRQKGFKWDGQTRRPNLEIPQRSAIQGLIARSEAYAKFIGEQLTITESVSVINPKNPL